MTYRKKPNDLSHYRSLWDDLKDWIRSMSIKKILKKVPFLVGLFVIGGGVGLVYLVGYISLVNEWYGMADPQPGPYDGGDYMVLGSLHIAFFGCFLLVAGGVVAVAINIGKEITKKWE